MAVSVALLGWDEEPIRVVQDVDWVLDDRADSTNRLEVITSLAEADGVDAEQEVIFKGRRFTVVDIARDRAADRAVIVADESQAALADVVIVDFKPNNWSLTRAMNAVLADTRWTLGEVNGVRYGQAHFDEITAMDALHFLARHQDAELSFDSLRRRVNITGSTGRTFEYVFTYGRQLANIEKQVQQPRTTVIYPTMAEDVELDPVEDYGYYLSQGLSLAEAKARFRKEEYWSDSRYEIAENMTRDAQKRLEEEAWPQITYTLTAQATLDVEGVDDFDLAELRLGDTVYVWDQEIDAKLSAKVTAVTTSSDQSQNELTLSTLPASLGDSVSGRGYFGDSGRPSSGGPRRSGPQPRPSMPILEDMGDYGIAVTRWNGQDHDGNYNTIPQRFGTLLTLVAPLEDGVIPSPRDSSHTFMGSDIETRGGGTSTIGFNGHGEFAIWHQMRGWDGETMSQLSEPLVVDVPPAWDPGPTVDKLDDLNDNRLPALRDRLDNIEPVIEGYDDRIQAAQDGAQSARDTAENLRDNVLPPLQGEIVDLTENRLPEVESTLTDTRLGMENLRDIRLPEMEDRLDAKASSSQLDAISNGVAALTGTNAKTFIQDTEPPPMTGVVTYEWAGTPHASESVKRVDGVEVARNLIRNPSFEENTDFMSVSSSMFTLTRVTTFAPRLVSGSRALVATTGEGANQFSFILQTVNLDGATGWLAMRAANMQAVGFSGAVNARLGFAVDGQWQYSGYGDTTLIRSASGGATVEHVAPIPSGATQARVMFYLRDDVDGSAPQEGRQYTSDGWTACVGATEAEARENARDYFDGDTPDEPAESGLWINTAEDDARYWWDHEQQAWVKVLDDAVFNRVVADRIFANLGVFDRIDAREGWIGGVALEDGAVDARHIMAENIAAAVGEFLHISADQIDTENLAAYLATIIELDAGQITAGKINTARLDAQEVAGAVANFLTLDALEINVEQLAGEIANIIEVTAESIQAGAIGTRHLAIADFENLLNEDALWDFREHGLNSVNWQVATGNAAGWLTFANQAQGAITLRYDAGQHASGASGDSGLRYAATGVGVSVNPGDQFHLSADTWVNSGSAGYLRLRARYTDEDGNNVFWQNIGDITTSGTAHSWEVPDDTNRRRMFLVFWADQGASGNAQIGRIRFRRKSGGELIVDGGIKARNLDAEEIFFDQAVGNTVAAGVGEFLELNADQIRSNSWTGTVATGATFQTHTAADRGVKMLPAGLRGWDSSGNLRFDLSSSTGNMLATGQFRTAVSGSRAVLDADTFGGRLSFYRGNGIGTLKLNDGLERLEMVFGDNSNPNQERPNIGVSETNAIVGYRQTQILVGGTTTSNQGIRVNGEFRDGVSFRDTIDMQWGARTRYYDNSNRLTATLGQSPSESGSQFQVWMNRGAFHIRNNGVFIESVYNTTSSTSANVFVSSSGWLSRATSASRYKLDQQELTVPDSILNVPMIDWIDKAQTEFKAEMDQKPRPFTESDQKSYDTIDLRRIPGVVAETVESHGGEQFVTYGPDGEIEEVMYDRLALAQIQVLKRRIEALEGAS